MTINFPEPTLVPVNPIRLAVHEAGDPEGAPIVLCHGFPELAFSWPASRIWFTGTNVGSGKLIVTSFLPL
ncbi:MAG: hypothetical protein P8Y95_13405, partial [Gammaproteobacteria bacterium]